MLLCVIMFILYVRVHLFSNSFAFVLCVIWPSQLGCHVIVQLVGVTYNECGGFDTHLK